MKDGTILGDLAKGALAGAVATWAMGGVTTWLYKRQDPAARDREYEATGGETSLKRAAVQVARFTGIDLDEDRKRRLAKVIHWAFGIGAGTTYALLRRRAHWAETGQGLAFGTAFWLAVDEGLVPLLGLSEGPLAYPWQSHARGFAGHLTYGLMTETALDLLDRVA